MAIDVIRLGTILHPPCGVPRERLARVGCTCAGEARCHRSVLGELLQEHGAVVRRRA